MIADEDELQIRTTLTLGAHMSFIYIVGSTLSTGRVHSLC
jgi:hypothetical protein